MLPRECVLFFLPHKTIKKTTSKVLQQLTPFSCRYKGIGSLASGAWAALSP